MLRTRWLIVAGAALLGSTGTARAQIERSRYFSQDTQYRAIEAVVRLTLYLDGKSSQGTGVCIGSQDGHSYILTAAHVIEGIENSRGLKVETFTQKSYPNAAEVRTERRVAWVRNEGSDLALLRVPVRVRRSIKLCPSGARLRVGTPALLIGCGKAAPPTCVVGKLTGLDGRKDLIVNRGGINGRSGGLLYTRYGLTGIVARGADDRTEAISPGKIRSFVRRARARLAAREMRSQGDTTEAESSPTARSRPQGKRVITSQEEYPEWPLQETFRPTREKLGGPGAPAYRRTCFS